MGRLNFVGIVAGAIIVFAGPSIEQGSRQIDWYHCNITADDILHPRDCTKFIKCSGGQAYEYDCPACDNDPSRCTVVNRLVYNRTVKACVWTDETKCETEVGGETRPMNAGAFDCGGHEGKNFPHPQNCTKFVQCSVSGKPFEHDCGRCDDVPDRCSEWNRLLYDSKTGKCMFRDEATCAYGDGGAGATALKVNAEIVLIFLGISGYLRQKFN